MTIVFAIFDFTCVRKTEYIKMYAWLLLVTKPHTLKQKSSHNCTLPHVSGVASPKFWERARVFGLGHRLSKHKTTRYVRNLGGHGPFPPWLRFCITYRALGSKYFCKPVITSTKFQDNRIRPKILSKNCNFQRRRHGCRVLG